MSTSTLKSINYAKYSYSPKYFKGHTLLRNKNNMPVPDDKKDSQSQDID